MSEHGVAWQDHGRYCKSSHGLRVSSGENRRVLEATPARVRATELLGGHTAAQRYKALGRHTLALVLVACTLPLFADKPVIDHQPVVCSVPAAHPRVCALVADDGAVKKVDVFFRAQGQEAFYRSRMDFDAINYCASLPIPSESTRIVEYYVRAIDDEVLIERTIDFKMEVDPDASCEYPVIDRDPERTSRLVVYATIPKQGKKIKGFERASVARFVPVKKR